MGCGKYRTKKNTFPLSSVSQLPKPEQFILTESESPWQLKQKHFLQKRFHKKSESSAINVLAQLPSKRLRITNRHFSISLFRNLHRIIINRHNQGLTEKGHTHKKKIEDKGVFAIENVNRIHTMQTNIDVLQMCNCIQIFYLISDTIRYQPQIRFRDQCLMHR